MAGFTAVELVIVMLLVGILAAVSLPLFMTIMQSYRLDGAARNVAGDLRYAQSLAVARGGFYRLHSGDEGGVNQPGRYRLEQSASVAGPWTPVTDASGSGEWYLLSSEFVGASLQSIRDNAGGTMYQVQFNSRGACANCAGISLPIVVTVSSTSGTRTVQVRSAGSVSIQ